MRRKVRGLLCSFLLFGLVGIQGACSSQQQDVDGDLDSDEYGQQQQGQEYEQDGDGGDNPYGQQEGENEYGGQEGENPYADDVGEGAEDPYGGAVAAAGGNEELASLVDEASNTPVDSGGDYGIGANPVDNVPGAEVDPAAPTTPVPTEGGFAPSSPALAQKGVAGLPAGPGLPEVGSKMVYIVEPGDTLGKISARIYGTPGRWQELASLSGLPDPNKIYPGDVIYYQLAEEAIEFATQYENAPKQLVTAQPGDTMPSIAQAVYGSSLYWKSIWRQNGHIDDPYNIPAGTEVYYLVTGSLTAEKTNKSQSEEVKVVSNQNETKDQLTVEMIPSNTIEFAQTEEKELLVQEFLNDRFLAML